MRLVVRSDERQGECLAREGRRARTQRIPVVCDDDVHIVWLKAMALMKVVNTFLLERRRRAAHVLNYPKSSVLEPVDR